MRINEIPLEANIEIILVIKKKEYVVKNIVKFVKDELVLVAPIKIGGTVLSVKKIDSVSVKYTSEKGLYRFDSVKMGVVQIKAGNVMHTLKCAQDVNPVNRRGAYRMFIGEQKIIYLENINGEGEKQRLFGTLKDVSETGMAIVMAEEINDPKIVTVKFVIDGTTIELKGKIRRKEPIEGKGFLYGCEFTNEYPRLSKYIYRNQLKKPQRAKKPLDGEDEKKK